MIQPAQPTALPKERQLIISVWEILKRYSLVDKTATNEDWERIIKDLSDMADIGKGTTLAAYSTEIATATANHFNRLYDSQQGEEVKETVRAAADAEERTQPANIFGRKFVPKGGRFEGIQRKAT